MSSFDHYEPPLGRWIPVTIFNCLWVILKQPSLLPSASLIPGVDTFADLAAIPVDLLRGDYVSVELDLVGAIPFIGEIADGAKTANRVVDTAKAFDKASDSAKA